MASYSCRTTKNVAKIISEKSYYEIWAEVIRNGLKEPSGIDI